MHVDFQLSMHKAPDDKVYLSGLTNGTEREVDTREADNVDADPIRTTERLKNASLRLNESSEEQHGASTVSPILLSEATYDTDRLDLASVTESSVKPETPYQYDNDTTGSSVGQSHTDTMENQGELTNSSRTSETTFESQQDVSERQRAYEKNNSTNNGEMRNDRVLMLDEPVIRDNVTNDGISAIETAISDDSADNEDDEVSSSDGNANISSENLTEYGQNDSVGSYRGSVFCIAS